MFQENITGSVGGYTTDLTRDYGTVHCPLSNRMVYEVSSCEAFL